MWIERLRVEGGRLDKFDQVFSPALNVLIGGRGTGKSSVIELLRFGLGATSVSEGGKQEALEHALGVLEDGRVVVTLRNGKNRIDVARTAQDVEPDASEQFAVPLVFSQAEIESIGLQSQSRLRLIDGFLPAGQRTSAEATLTAKIKSTTTEIRSLLGEIDDIGEKTTGLPKLAAELDALRAQAAAHSKANKDIDVDRKGLADLTPLLSAASVKSETITRAYENLFNWNTRFENILESKSGIAPWPTQAGSADELVELRKRERSADRSIRAALDELRLIAEELEKKRDAAASQRAGLENRARDIRQKIEERQKGASALDKRMSDLAQQISVMKSLAELRKDRERKVKQLEELRSQLLAEQEKSRQSRTKQREKIAGTLTSKLGPTVRVTMMPFAQHQEYENLLTAALRGSGLRYKELAKRISETFSPQEIAGLAEARDIETISATLEITDERALRLCDALREQGGSALFSVAVEDDAQFELLDGSDYKGIDFLSMGQRCTVILPIVLFHTERAILLDQPEDHLDNAFIVGTLLKAVQNRSSAQTIIATHNPNIPVLGEASKVIHLDSDGSRCFARSAGPIDAPPVVEAITTLMEGGRDAFARRASFYERNSRNASKH